MKLDTIEIPADEAKVRLAEYTESLRHNRDAEDERIAAGYRAAARGMPIIRLSETIAAGGYFDNGLPRIAVVRADAKQCWVKIGNRGADRVEIVYADDPFLDNRGALVGRFTVRVQVDDRRPVVINRRWRGQTVVPVVPPRHRPKRGRLGRFHVLWEVEEWAPVPPHDPALLRHIGGDLWAVVAMWDLTELERAVLAGRS